MDKVTNLRQHLSKAHFENDRELELLLLRELGDSFSEVGDFHSARESYEQALGLAQNTGDRHSEATLLSRLGNAYSTSEQPQQALSSYERALVIAMQLQDLKLIGNTLSSLGLVYKDIGEITRAIDSYEKALTIARQMADRKAEGALLGNLGNAYVAQGQTSRAIEYYEQALTTARQLSDLRSESALLGNLGNAYAAQGQLHSAIVYYEQALTLVETHSVIQLDPISAAIYRNRGNAYIALEEFPKAIIDYNRAITLDPDDSAAYASRGDALAHIERYDEALASYDQAIRLDPNSVYQSQRLQLLARIRTEDLWRRAEEQYKNGELIKARVIDVDKNGLMVDVSGIQGFVPISQILNLKREEVAAGGESQETADKLASMRDKELQFKIIEINRTRHRLILSERLAVQEWRQRRREELLDELKPGDVRKGVVSNLANFGAFIDLGGADGLVHISQLSWSLVNHPSEVLHIGQEVEVQVLSVDKEKKKIALSIKRVEGDPWTTVEQRYTPGQIVTGTITKIAPFGAFARIEDGIEGLIHLSELTPGMDPKAALHEGMQLQLRILRIDAERRRLGLSLRQADEVDAKEAPTEPSADSGSKGAAGDMMSLEETSARQEAATTQAENSTSRRSEGRGERRERAERSSENPLLGNLPLKGEGETTAMAEAFRRADRQRTKEDTEAPEQ
jgi:small subunit ribosomal protein S1